ncbi:MAG: F0F1 ATP synthase subunit delta [bacterium]
MKYSPQIYAQTLIEAVKDSKDCKAAAKNFWHLLNKNNQGKDLDRVIEALDEESAKLNHKTFVRVYSNTKLTDIETQQITAKLIKKGFAKITIKNIIKNNIIGYIVKIEDNIIDLTLENKVEKLKKVLTK